MAERARRLALSTIPAHRAFGDALAAGLKRRFGDDPLQFARGIVLVPNNRARRSISDAFVRASGGALLLPRLVAIGDTDLEEAVGAMLDTADEADPPPPAIDPLERRLVLARLVGEARMAAGEPVDAAEAVRLAGTLARTLDQLLAEEIAPDALRAIDLAPELSEHWSRALALFDIVLDRWPAELAARGRIDLAARRSLLLRRVAARWRVDPPPSFVCAAGITTSAPAVADLLRSIAELPRGMVVLPGLDLAMPDEQWDALGPHAVEAGKPRRRAHETHGQYHLKLLLARMGAGRGEVRRWQDGSEHDAPPARGRAVAHALAPAEFTHHWVDLPASDRGMSGMAIAAFPNPAAEAQGIAIRLREALETPGRTAALVTPDRDLAARVAAHCARWGIAIDDSAGRALSLMPPGTLLLALAEGVAQRLSPVALLALVKHPLVRAGEARAAWLDGARALDRLLRGPRPPAGLDAIDRLVAGEVRGVRPATRARAQGWWAEARPLLAPLEAADEPRDLAGWAAWLRERAAELAGDALWDRAEGRAAADLIAAIEEHGRAGPEQVEAAALPAVLRALMDEIAVRPPQGGHPRLAIYGPLEARLQTADLMILGGMNEGVWPGLAAPDPWLAPRIRAELGLPALERRIGLAAHDLAGALGAQQVLLTRALRDASAPTVASRFLLRLIALSSGDLADRDVPALAARIDRADAHRPAPRPHPSPPAEWRPKEVRVTEVDRLKADPYAFYAQRILSLSVLDPVDADPSPAWRGTKVHDVLECWAREDGCDPARLHTRAESMFGNGDLHPLLAALWRPRLIEAVDWIARETEAMQASGRQVIDVERKGTVQLAGVKLTGKYDRIDRDAAGGLVIVDYKTGMPPSAGAVRAGFNLQLGLLGAIAEAGGFEGVSGTATGFEYWSLAKKKGAFGYIASPVDAAGRYGRLLPDEMVPNAVAQFAAAVDNWLLGDAPFTAKLRPEYAAYADFDQLMRADEWVGRD